MTPELADLIELADADLFIILASLAPTEGIGRGDEENREQLGRAWFRTQQEQLHDTICLHPAVVSSLASDAVHDPLITAGIVADAISSLGQGPAVFAFAVLLVRYGLEKYCLGQDANR